MDVSIRDPPGARPIPLVAVPRVADLASLPRPIRACPDCGYLGIRPARWDEGAVAGFADLMSAHLCPHCAYRGLPVEFDAAEDYVEYVESLHRAWRKKS